MIKSCVRLAALTAAAGLLLSAPITAEADGTSSSTASTSATSTSTTTSSNPPSTASPTDAAPPTTTDYAPLSNIKVTLTGPSDLVFMKQEGKYNAVQLSGSNAWHGFHLQSGRDITVQMPINRAVDSVSIELEQVPKFGIYYPQQVDFEVNVDGNWYLADSAKTQIPTWDKNITTQTFTGHLKDIQTNLVRIHFSVDSWVFARHVKVNVLTSSSSTPQPLPNLPPAPEPVGAPLSVSDPRSAGIHNMLLVYTDGSTANGQWSSHDFLPMIAYMARGGALKDRMFDAMLFLPYGSMVDNQIGWQMYLNSLFTPGSQLDALNTAVGQANAGLSTPGVREKVVIALPYPKFGDGTWGIIGNQVESFNATKDDPLALASRTQALNWYIQTLAQMWQKAHFSNLTLTGLYWMNENLAVSAPAEVPLVHGVADAAHAMKLPLCWIPYYGAAGVGEWQSLGLDAAWLQPHYIELGKSADVQRLQNSQALASDAGMGVEMETPGNVLTDQFYYNLYLGMLDWMEKNHLAGNVSHAFYAGSKVLVKSAYSDSGLERSVYDYTYQFLAHP